MSNRQIARAAEGLSRVDSSYASLNGMNEVSTHPMVVTVQAAPTPSYMQIPPGHGPEVSRSQPGLVHPARPLDPSPRLGAGQNVPTFGPSFDPFMGTNRLHSNSRGDYHTLSAAYGGH